MSSLGRAPRSGASTRSTALGVTRNSLAASGTVTGARQEHYHDTPLPIGFDKTVSQPFICAFMTDLLDPQPHEAVLEVGTGLGYQAAVLAELARKVWTVENGGGVREPCGGTFVATWPR